MADQGRERSKVCVTGGSGYIASCLVKKLLERGYTVHATLRNLDDESKVKLLKTLPGAETRLALFKADICRPDEFENAIRGCECVFHVAHQTLDYKNTVEEAVACARAIAQCCVSSGTVRRLIYTSSIFAASPLKEDGSGFKDFVDESCWTPLSLPIPYTNDFLEAYKDSKTLAEKAILSFRSENSDELEVVSLVCGLVGGESLLQAPTGSVEVILSQLTNKESYYNSFKCLEELCGHVPLVHLEDVCEAHIFCMENPGIVGRVMCASSLTSTVGIATYYQQNYPQLHIKQEYLEGPKRQIEWTSSILTDMGFEFKFETKKILDDSLNYALRMGQL